VIAVGVGASRGCPPAELGALVADALRTAGVAPRDVGVLASADLKADEPAVVALASARGWRLATFPADALAAVTVPTPSATVARHVGTPSVAEASALLAAAPAELLVAKQRSRHATCAIARARTTLPAASRDDSATSAVVQSSLDAPETARRPSGGPR
jgi:cobalt-precorrin 5A hydrolase